MARKAAARLQVNTRIPADLVRQLEEAAAALRMERADLIRRALEDWLAAWAERGKPGWRSPLAEPFGPSKRRAG
ncbi:MAG: ribbon-helix-helix domain-containing protein [Thermoanaerobaculia bacterium]